jgi:hypothetical protein
VKTSCNILLPLLFASLLLLVSCQKPAGEQQQTAGQNQVAQPATPGESARPVTPGAGGAQPGAPEKPQPAQTPTPAAATAQTSGGQLVPLEIRLPKPMFVGTPTNIDVPNLEKPLGGPRPPFLAPAGTKNLAFKKPVSGSDEQPIIGELSMITDGDKEAAEGSFVEMGPGVQYVTIDLKNRSTINAVVVWHYHKQPVVYRAVVVQVSDDRDFITGVQTVFNNDIGNSCGRGVGKEMSYVETAEGKLIDARGVQGRYVRLYSRGNTSNDLNHYIEVEVYGKAVQ